LLPIDDDVIVKCFEDPLWWWSSHCCTMHCTILPYLGISFHFISSLIFWTIIQESSEKQRATYTSM